ncbi:hypothetical protein V5799_021437 [Amblyomma americanum]|uniref:Uncharacterized protein n=1 Tax=Amblyomma americanum TaxID=6943 RepID=A0AAQ4FPV9_AMBAM
MSSSTTRADICSYEQTIRNEGSPVKSSLLLLVFGTAHALSPEADLGELIERYWYDVRFEFFIEGRKSTTYCISTEQAPTVRLQQLRLVDITRGHYEASLLILVTSDLPELQLESCEQPRIFLTIKLSCVARSWKTPPQRVRSGITCIGYVVEEDEELHYGDLE